MNKKKVVGFITVTLVLGYAGYCIKKYIDLKKEEPEISLDEAKAMVNIQKMAEKTTIEVAEKFGMSSDEINELVDDAHDEVGWNRSFGIPDDQYDFYDDVDYQRPLAETMKEEDKVLRFEANSIQARDQFIKMELAELIPMDRPYQIMKRLFEFPFEPIGQGDELLYTKLSDYRMEFFGDSSVWTDDITMADVILHYARNTDFNVGGGEASWIFHILQHTEFNELASSQAFEEIINQLNTHSYFNAATNTHSLFGILPDYIDDARNWAERSVDGMLSYDIEFNTFLQTGL